MPSYARGGERHSRKRIARLMGEAGLRGQPTPRRPGDNAAARDCSSGTDLVDRNFAAGAPNLLWVADIALVQTTSGSVYLAVVLDACSRKIVG